MIREKANKTKTQARKLHDEADQLTGRLAATEGRIDRLDESAKKDNGLAEDTKAKVGKALTDTKAAINQVNTSTNIINSIRESLMSLPDINIDELKNLEKRLDKAEKDLAGANLSQRLESLQEMKSEQNKWINEYVSKITLLESEVSNIKAISEALPDGCYKRIRLEI